MAGIMFIGSIVRFYSLSSGSDDIRFRFVLDGNEGGFCFIQKKAT